MTDEARQEESPIEVTKQAADIVSAYVSNNALSTTDVPKLIAQVHDALQKLRDGPQEKKVEPVVPLKKAVSRDHVTCLLCGAKKKMLKRHLNTAHGLSEQEYRTRYQLPRDFPLVAPEYAKRRSQWAKKIGLGKKRGKRAKAA